MSIYFTFSNRLRMLALSALLFVTACSNSTDQAERNNLAAVKVQPSAMSVSLNVDDSGSLSAQSLANLNRLLQLQGKLRYQYLQLTPYTRQGKDVALHIEEQLQNLGIRPENIQLLTLKTAQSHDNHWDLKVSSKTLVVNVPDCHISDMSSIRSKPFASVGVLGCANRTNLALMIADPKDLLRPKILDSADGIRAVNAVDRYHNDEVNDLLDIDFEN